MKYLLSFFFAVVVSVSGRPSDSKLAPLTNDLNEAFQPVEKQFRSLYDTLQSAAKDMAQETGKSVSELTESGRSLMSPIQEKDRANLPQSIRDRLENAVKRVRTERNDLIKRAMVNSNTVMGAEKSALFSVDDAMKMLENKYLTPDGQQLVRVLRSIANVNV